MKDLRTHKIAVIGLGYVGLPLAVEFAKKYDVVGFDIDEERVAMLNNNIDRTGEVSEEVLKNVASIMYTHDQAHLKAIDVYIVTVPTPIDANKRPDLEPLKSASQLVGKHLKKGAIVIYESTVYPGCTEEVCVPELEKASDLTYNKDFYCGYSPERINPGDKEHRIDTIIKVTSGSTPEIAETVDALYGSIVKAGTHKTSSIKIAEAAKVIENAQRDINIAFVNELALIFDRLNINTKEVLEAAATKWNFSKFTPGLVGGHCIGVDPYYLTYKAQHVGYHPEVILAGRKINDNMGSYIAHRYIKLLLKAGIDHIKHFKTLILGFTFKENCNDVRNTRVIDIYRELCDFGMDVDIWDPVADHAEVREKYGIEMTRENIEDYSGIIIAVAHNEFIHYDWQTLSKGRIIFDVKNSIDPALSTGRL